MNSSRIVATAIVAAAAMSGCSTIPEPAQPSRVVCSGHLRVNLPATWTPVESTRGTEARGAQNVAFELVTLLRPSDDDAEVSPPSALATLQEFAALKTRTVASIAKIRYWPYAEFRLASTMPTMSMYSLYREAGVSTFTAQYLLGEPGSVHMITFDKKGVDDKEDVEQDRRAFDSIVRTATWADAALDAGSPQCR